MSLPLLAELQRRRVFRALVGYGIAAFAVLQIIEPIMHGLRWPEAVLSYVVVALGAGFPVVVTLAWIFDVNAGRIERTAPAAPLRGPRGAPLVAMLVGIGLLAAAPGLGWYFLLRGRDRPAAQAARGPSIAVLPFANLSGEKEDEYFSDGMTEELIDALANIEGIHVVARTSAFAYKGKNANVRQIGEELNVATVLEGSVRRRGKQLRVVAQLIGAADGYHIWSKTYDRELQNIFAVEDELVRAIVQALTPRLVPVAAMVPKATASSEAHDLYLRGRFFWNQRTKEGLKKAQALFEQAIALDPGYALAHSGLADCYSLSKDYGQARAAEVLPKAKAHARKAVELDGALAEGHASLGLLGMQDYQWGIAERELKRAIELRPAYATAHHWYSLALRYTGRTASSRAEAEQALRLDPTSMMINNVVAIGFFIDRDYDRAIAQELKAVDLDPAAELPRYFLARLHDQLGRFAEALAVLDQAPAQSAWVRCTRARVLAASGDRAAARQLLADVEKRFAAEPVPPGVLADVHLALGDKDRAFQWLERGVEERDQLVSALMVGPWWDSIRSDPRYHRLLARMNLE